MAVFAKGGIASVATTSAASTRPSASAGCSRVGARRSMPSSTRACASASGITRGSPRSQVVLVHHVAQHLGDGGTHVGPLERELDVGAQEPELLPDVVAALDEQPAVHGLLVEQQRDRVRELQLAAASGLDAAERV